MIDYSVQHHRLVGLGLWAGLTIVFAAGATTTSFDASALPWIIGVIAVLTAGFIGGASAVLRGRRAGWFGLLGWIPLPVMHLWTVATVDEGWIAVFTVDLVGILVGLGLAMLAMAAAQLPANPGSRWDRIERARSSDPRPDRGTSTDALRLESTP